MKYEKSESGKKKVVRLLGLLDLSGLSGSGR